MDEVNVVTEILLPLGGFMVLGFGFLWIQNLGTRIERLEARLHAAEMKLEAKTDRLEARLKVKIDRLNQP